MFRPLLSSKKSVNDNKTNKKHNRIDFKLYEFGENEYTNYSFKY